MRVYDSIDAPHVLKDGRWQLQGGIQVWIGDKPQPPSARRRLLACPTCHAVVDQLCRTKTGHHRQPHASRLIGKRCSCGSLLAFNKKLCDLCRKAARRENGRIGMRNTRARRKAA